MSRNVEFGVFLPVGQGGFVMSTNRPPTPATYEHNRKITMLAEELRPWFRHLAGAVARFRRPQ